MIRKVLIALPVVLAAHTALAVESAPVRSDRVVATLVSDTDAVQAGIPMHVGLRLLIKPGWHTYWSNPGDAGAPPELTLTVPADAKATGIEWPTPQRLPEGPVMTYGYTNEVVLPITVTPGAGPLTVEASATWLVCEKICVPEEGKFSISLPPGAVVASSQAPLIRAALDRRPRPSPFETSISPDGTLSVVGAGLLRATVRDAWFFPSDWGPVDQAAPQNVVVKDGTIKLALKPGPAFKPATPLEGVLVLRDPGGQETYLQVTAKPVAAAPTASLPIAQVILFALLGGLILNLMPCVFPILAMKAVAISRLSGGARGPVRTHAAVYTLGVLIAFAGLGGTLLFLRGAGMAAGWGFQFQSPVFVAIMAWVLFGVGLNLSGVFNVGGSLAGAGQGLASQDGHLGSFFTGLLAVLVATPCTAPFMGVAIAAALTAPPILTIAVFLAMGLGLAAPYTLLAVAPGLVRLLPRPGGWMDILKNVLAFPMYGASIWLLWVVSLQAGSDGMLATAIGMLMLAFAAWALGKAQGSSRRWGYGVAIIAAMLVPALLPTIGSASPAGTAATAEGGAEPFTPDRLAALRASGRPVFVNMTAAWCVTCLVNERVALSPAPVRKAFADSKVAYLKGDWTRGDPAITSFLKQHARDGVPLYVLYPPDGGEPAVLPQVLTEAEMLDQLKKFGG